MISPHSDVLIGFFAWVQYNPYGGVRSQPKDTYPEAALPLASREDSNLPLTGAVQAPPDYIIPDGAKVCCRPQVPLAATELTQPLSA